MAEEARGDDVLWSGGELEEQGNYPLLYVPDTIEPGVMMFTLWTRPKRGEPEAFDFGFDWDGDTHAGWACGGCGGDADWPGDDLALTISSSTGTCTTTIEGAGLGQAVYLRSEWISLACRIFAQCRKRALL